MGMLVWFSDGRQSFRFVAVLREVCSCKIVSLRVFCVSILMNYEVRPILLFSAHCDFCDFVVLYKYTYLLT